MIGQKASRPQERDALGHRQRGCCLRRIGRWLRALDVRRHVAERRAVEALLADLLYLSADAIIMIDGEQRIRRFNRGAEAVFGYRADEIIDQPLDRLIPDRFVEAHHQHVHAFAESSEVARLMAERRIITGLRKNGQEFPAEASITKMTVGAHLYFAVILRDITARKRAEEKLRQSEERFRRVFAYSNDAIFVADAAGHIIDVNPKGCQMFGYSPEEFCQLMLRDLHPADADRFDVFARNVVQHGVGWTDELVCLTRSGEEIPTEVSASVVDFEDRRLIIAIVRDITARKELERMKDDFVSNVSHELRTPIASIRLIPLLIGRDPLRRDLYLKRLTRETERLARIVDDLLNLSRIDQGRLEVKRAAVDLNRLVTEYVSDRQPLARSRELVLSTDLEPDLPPVCGDEGLLGQALSILLTNAINYTPPGGDVTVSTRLDRDHEPPLVGVRVTDTGHGIEPGESGRLFDRFYRGHAGQMAGMPGTGLGLAIAREIADRHDGYIEVASDGIGQGASFTLWLPLEEAESGVSPA